MRIIKKLFGIFPCANNECFACDAMPMTTNIMQMLLSIEILGNFNVFSSENDDDHVAFVRSEIYFGNYLNRN